MRAGVGTPAAISVPGGVPGLTCAPRRRRLPSPALLRRLRAPLPDDAILSAATVGSPGHAGRPGVIDPLDGTANYAHGLPVFGVSIALEAERGIILGVVYDPPRDELFVAERGRGAT